MKRVHRSLVWAALVVTGLAAGNFRTRANAEGPVAPAPAAGAAPAAAPAPAQAPAAGDVPLNQAPANPNWQNLDAGNGAVDAAKKANRAKKKRKAKKKVRKAKKARRKARQS